LKVSKVRFKTHNAMKLREPLASVHPVQVVRLKERSCTQAIGSHSNRKGRTSRAAVGELLPEFTPRG
jgi:hypothetical protein